MMAALFRILIVLAAIMGADGVILAAAVGASAGRGAAGGRRHRCCCFTPPPCSAVVALTERGVIHARIGHCGRLRALSSRPPCSRPT